MWQCPLCKSPIDAASATIKCSNNHCFDKAKSGYINLLPVQFKKSKSPGDDKTMVRARREFHDNNGYAPLKTKMTEIISDYFSNNEVIRIYDAGCGEGSYLHTIVAGLTNLGFQVSGAGSDIAKIAVELAAKAYKKQQFVVASSFDLPLAPASQDGVIQVFAPGSDEEYARIIKPDGLLLTVNPAPSHLFELKALVYDNPEKHIVEYTERKGFTLLRDETLTYRLDFNTEEQKIALIKMTPYYWRLSETRLTSIVKALTSVTVDFQIQVWKRLQQDNNGIAE